MRVYPVLRSLTDSRRTIWRGLCLAYWGLEWHLIPSLCICFNARGVEMEWLCFTVFFSCQPSDWRRRKP